MTRMFKVNGKVMKTWNPFTGCLFGCSYCWVDDVILKLLRMGNTAYKTIGKNPTFHPERLKVRFHPGETVFVCDMGDISAATWPEIYEILQVIEANPATDFLIMTKSPGIYTAGAHWPANVIQGITIETNRWYSQISKAPPPLIRYNNILDSRHQRKLVSIEPVMDFDPEFVRWLVDISPDIIQIGADNYRHNLPEPSWDKVASLISKLEDAGMKGEQKDGLARLNEYNI